ncbi:lung adenoma susceptibility protein 2 isoform X2 [Oxyura jamaicensis]|uniref:lung adenoma susceptibility protein 2 isoform X2 n=1 Tax=Oxyura jamaicensis TaxID=8884 RepID=UPI0015A6103A|nr:lung adenoma susceptibility protein 2 isoform X2 [Oxyura jamaicensis]
MSEDSNRNLDKNHDQLNKKHSVSSPDSAVSFLLTSVGSSNSCSNSLIRYKDKLYSSASEALEAYIADFDLSLTSSEITTGKICLCQSTPKQAEFSKHRVKEKYALDDCNEHTGLSSLASPCRRETECDPDLISLATDDLLAFPADGSLPCVPSSPFKSIHQNSEWNRWSLKKSVCPYHTVSLDTERGFCLQENGKADANQNVRKHFSKKKHNAFTPNRYNSVSSKGSSRPLSVENSATLPAKNYPRWLTSQKSDLNVSGISSIPSFHYPVWLKSHNLFSAATKESGGHNFNIQGETSSSQTFEILKKQCSVDKDSSDFLKKNGCLDLTGDNEAAESCKYDSPDALFQSGASFSRHTKQSFGEDRLELLTLRADRDLESSNEDSSNTLENGSSPSTTDILGAERSWENVLGAFKSPVPACCEDKRNPLPFPKADIIHKFLEDCLNDKNKENVFSGDHNPRPLEALKFQAIQGSSNPNEMAEQKEEFEKLFEKADAEFKLCDSEIIPPTNSIQKALHYVSCLKSLLEDTITKQEQSDDHQENKEENS